VTLAPNTFAQGQSYLFDSDPGDPNSEHTDEFYRGISHINIVIGSGNNGAIGIHWAQSQATHIRNVSMNLGDAHAGIFMENGSGGFIGDLNITGGDTGMIVGNQQWVFRNIAISNAQNVGIDLIWDWQFMFLALSITNCPTAIQFQGGAAGSVTLIDSYIANAAVAIQTDYPARVPGILLERFVADNVGQITANLSGNPSGSVTVDSWRQGPSFINGAVQNGLQGQLPLTRPDTPLPTRARPTFGSPDGTSGVFNAYDAGAKGDGVHDDTAALQQAITNNAQVFLPQGVYLVSAPLVLRPDSVLVGEALSNLQAIGGSSAWADASNPAPLLQVPSGSSVQLADLIFTLNGPAPGCSFLEWQAGPAGGLWDVHWRVTNTSWGLLHISDDPKMGPTGGYFENFWAWVADHDINTGNSLTVDNPRGVTISSNGPLYLYSTAAEHSALYQYNITGASQITTIMTQTETAYWQNPPSGWAMTITSSSDLHLYGTGFYNWFNGNQTALFNVQSSTAVQMYDVNVYGTLSVLVGSQVILANDTTVKNWFCDYFVANIQQ
jgi:glucan 1,3-beta-glucosidase